MIVIWSCRYFGRQLQSQVFCCCRVKHVFNCDFSAFLATRSLTYDDLRRKNRLQTDLPPKKPLEKPPSPVAPVDPQIPTKTKGWFIAANVLKVLLKIIYIDSIVLGLY